MANERRLRSGFVAGVTTTALTNVATSMASAALADLPAVDSTAHAPIVFTTVDANGRVTAKEVIYVTAHTAAATTATILRAQEGTTALAWTNADKWQHGPTVRDLVRHRHSRRTATTGVTTSYTSALAIVVADGSWDLTMPAYVGDVIEAYVSTPAAPSVSFEVASVVAGVAVNYLFSGGITPSSGVVGEGRLLRHVVLSGDLSGGTITLRVYARAKSGFGSAAIAAVSASDAPLVFMASNLGPESAST